MLNDNTYTILRFFILIYVLAIIWWVFRYNVSVRKEKRINKFTLKNSTVTSDVSLGDAFIILINNLSNRLANHLEKVAFITRMAKPYEKYTYLFNVKIKPVLFLSYKVIIFITLLIFSLFYIILMNQTITLFEIILILLVSYYGVNLTLRVLSMRHRRHLKEQLLDAIILMNNAYEAGKSTILALENVYMELDNEMGREFKIVHTDVSKGLGVDEAFIRLAERTKLKEIDYISSSITVMNKSGGNIIKVFNRILKGYYLRKKTEAEINAVLVVSKITMFVLMVMPIFFILVITLVNPTYFNPLFNSLLGNFILLFIIFIYVIYIFVANKMIKGVKLW